MDFDELSASGVVNPDLETMETALNTGLVVLDTNVLLGLYRRPGNAARAAIDLISSIQDRIWIPNQVAREFWRARRNVIRETTTLVTILDQAEADVRANLNQLGKRKADHDSASIAKTQKDFTLAIQELREEFLKNYGEFVTWNSTKNDADDDRIAPRLIELLKGRVGDPLLDEEAMIAEGLGRFASRIAPGFGDASMKSFQPPERGTGDFLIWEQLLRHAHQDHLVSKVVLVTDDIKKEDWVDRFGGAKEHHAAKPSLVFEAQTRAGVDFFVVSAERFFSWAQSFRLLEGDQNGVENAELLIPRTELWLPSEYALLLRELESIGAHQQIAVIRAAARAGGYLERSDVYQVSERSTDQSLRRFSLPALRAYSKLITESTLSATLSEPLVAQYEGPGRAVGYSVPSEFTEFEDSDGWLTAARKAVGTEPDREWTINEMVDYIRAHHLRDLSQAKTPTQTLSTELRYRQPNPPLLVQGDRNGWILANEES